MIKEPGDAPILNMFHRDVIAVDASGRERLEAMIKISRRTLKRFARAESPSAILNELGLIGGADEAGMLVRLAALDLDGDGHLSAQEYSAFMMETQELFQGIKDSVLNQSVIAALLLAISAPFLLGPFEVLYPTSWQGSGMTSSAALMELEQSTSAWGDTAAFFEPTDHTKAARIRRVLFLIEVLIFTVSMFAAAVALKTSKQVYQSLNSMPGSIAKLSYLLKVPRAFAYCNWATDLSLQCLLLGMAFAASRVTFISFLSILGCMILFVFFQVRERGKSGTANVTIIILHEEAQRALSKSVRESVAERSPQSMCKSISMAASKAAHAACSTPHQMGSTALHVGSTALQAGSTALQAGSTLMQRGTNVGKQLYTRNTRISHDHAYAPSSVEEGASRAERDFSHSEACGTDACTPCGPCGAGFGMESEVRGGAAEAELREP